MPRRSHWRWPQRSATYRLRPSGAYYQPTPFPQARFGGKPFRSQFRPAGIPSPISYLRGIFRVQQGPTIPTLTLVQIKAQFFDREMYGRYENAEYSAMSRTGAYGMTLVRRSMRWVSGQRKRYPPHHPRAGQQYVYYRPSVAPRPPHARRGYGHLRRFTLFWYDRVRQSVVIGPAYLALSRRTFRSSKTVPQIHEEGGSASTRVLTISGYHRGRARRQRATYTFDWVRSIYPRRPFIQPAYPVTKEFFRKSWRDSMERRGFGGHVPLSGAIS